MLAKFRVIVQFTIGLMPLITAGQSLARTPWPRNGWKIIETSQSYPQLLDSLKQAVAESDLNVVFDVGPTEAAAKRGIEIPGNRVIGVFNNHFAVDVLRLSVPAMIEAPLRFYVTERDDGRATLSWVEPAHVYAPYIEALTNEDDARRLREKARELDDRFARIAQKAAKAS